MDINGRHRRAAARFRGRAEVEAEHVGLQARRRRRSSRSSEPIESLLNADGTLRKIPNIGPSSTRVILEVLHTGSVADRRARDRRERADRRTSNGAATCASTF